MYLQKQDSVYCPSFYRDTHYTCQLILHMFLLCKIVWYSTKMYGLWIFTIYILSYIQKYVFWSKLFETFIWCEHIWCLEDNPMKTFSSNLTSIRCVSRFTDNLPGVKNIDRKLCIRYSLPYVIHQMHIHCIYIWQYNSALKCISAIVFYLVLCAIETTLQSKVFLITRWET